MEKIDFLRLICLVLQLPIIVVIIVLCYRAIRVLKFDFMNLVMVAFFTNFLYIILNILNSKMFKYYFFSGAQEPQLEWAIEAVDVITFTLFIAGFYLFFAYQYKVDEKDKSYRLTKNFQKYKKNILIVLTLFFLLTGIELIKSPLTSREYVIVAILYKATGLALIAIYFKTGMFKSNKGFPLLIFGISIWFILQFTGLFFYNRETEYDYVFFFSSMIGKVCIATSIFISHNFHEKYELMQKQAIEFQKILETTFHEINFPISAMSLTLAQLAKADNSKGQKYQELESDFEKIHGIILNAQEQFKNVPSNNQETVPEVIDHISSIVINVNLNRVIQKCITVLKDQYSDHNMNFSVKFGTAVRAKGNESEIFQIIINLLRNAVEAYDENTENRAIQITTGFRLPPEEETATVPFIEISDKAGGISPENQNKMWDRGFSTKNTEEKKIRGQGLYIVNLLATQNNIHVELNPKNSHKNPGTTFTLFFKKF